MAKTFDPNRVQPGTIELVRDANGNYTTKVVGLESINSLSLPEISTTAAVTKTDTDTKTATDITGDTLQSQTQMASAGPIPAGASPTDPSGAGGGNIGTGNVPMPGEAGFSQANTQPTRGKQTQ